MTNIIFGQWVNYVEYMAQGASKEFHSAEGLKKMVVIYIYSES